MGNEGRWRTTFLASVLVVLQAVIRTGNTYELASPIRDAGPPDSHEARSDWTWR